MFTESSLKSHSLTAVQIYGVRVNLCTLLASKVSLPSCTLRMIFLYNYIYFLRNAIHSVMDTYGRAELLMCMQNYVRRSLNSKIWS